MKSETNFEPGFDRSTTEELLIQAERLEKLASLVHQPDLADSLRQMAAECRMRSTSRNRR